jgi:3-hydroxy-9,10-secoandrosta-1,3,5(10)-triene-9,17-dione monooxygenase reductase component
VSASTAVDPLAFRRVIGQFATGVTVITVQRDDIIHGMTANAVTSVSLDPPLVLFCVTKQARMAALLRGAAGFAINILASDQEAVSRQFAGARKDEAVQSVELEHGPVAPLLAGAIGALSCVVDALHEGGDHWIVVGRVVALHEDVDGQRAPLVFFRSRYHHLVARELAAPAPPETWENDAIRVYHAEWSEGDEPEALRDAVDPWG